MKRKLIFIIVGALVVLGLIIFVWFWFFGQGPKSPEDFGFFNTASSTGTPGTGTLNGGNQQTPFGQNSISAGGDGSANIQTPLTTYTVGGQTGGVAPPITITVTTTTVTGITWLDGSGGGTGSTKTFTPTPINQINNVGISGTGYFNNAVGPSGPGLLETLVGTGVAGAIACTPGLLSGIAGGTGISAALSVVAVTVNAPVQNAVDTSNTVRDNFLNCIARTIARSVIQQVTASIVDWINSGFDGKPAFVQDYKQFFTNVADRAAGEFIQGSDLAFLCSPFKLQVRIAIAQSYAHQRSGSNAAATSCTLSKAVTNVDDFLNNGFSSGGWGGLLAFTTEPTNNPYGATMYAQMLLNNKILADSRDAGLKISPGGFLSKEECTGPINTVPGTPNYGKQTSCKIVTPGQTIEAELHKTLGTNIDSLNLADNFDEIISALINQLMTRVLYQGLANISGQNGYAGNFSSGQDVQAQIAAEALLTKLQGAVGMAQQYGTTKQGSITDIQNAQAQLVGLQNCWSTAASSTGLTASQQAQALASVAAADAAVQALELQVASYNTEITRANAAIVTVQEIQTAALAARTLKEVRAADVQFATAEAAGEFITQNDVTTALQDRTTLQAQLAAQNQTTQAELTQCYAFGL